MALELQANANASLDASLGASLQTSFPLNQCQGTACFTFARLIPGTTVTVVGDSGHVYGPATFIGFNNTSCAVTLRETDPFTPGATTTIVIDCTKVESISYTS